MIDFWLPAAGVGVEVDSLITFKYVYMLVNSFICCNVDEAGEEMPWCPIHAMKNLKVLSLVLRWTVQASPSFSNKIEYFFLFSVRVLLEWNGIQLWNGWKDTGDKEEEKLREIQR